MSQAIWLQALKTVPQVDKTQWDSFGIFTRWLIAARFSVTLMTFSSAIIGILIALSHGAIAVGVSIYSTITLTQLKV